MVDIMQQEHINSIFAVNAKKQIINFLDTYQMSYKDHGSTIDVFKGHNLYIEIENLYVLLKNDQNQILAKGSSIDVLDGLNGTLSFTV